MAFDNLKLDKALYSTGKGFTQALEEIDPSEQYRGTALEGLDAYERQLKRFGIRISGMGSDRVEKFFRSADTAALFPEYIARAVQSGLENTDKTSSIVAATTLIDGMDYRSLSCESSAGGVVGEGAALPVAQVLTKSALVNMRKHGCLLNASYEALRFQRLDLLTVTLHKIGADIAKELLGDAVDVLVNGDGNTGTAASVVNKAGSALAYTDLLTLWNSFDTFNMTTILTSAGMAQQILALAEMRDGTAGLDFQGTGNLVTPLGAELIKSAAVPAGALVAFDKNCALEKVDAGGIVTDVDSLIDHQFQRASISSTIGFAKIFPAATIVMD